MENSLRPKRRDAVANQERVLAAAVTTMLREGRHVPMSVIATEAGVGVATLYRKYANREALLDALTERALALLAETAERVRGEGGSGLAQLDRWWDAVIADYDQLVLPLHGGPAELTAQASADQQRVHACLRAILEAGREDGSLRSDITLADLVYFGAMLVTPIFAQHDWRSVAARQKDIHLAGLTPAGGSARPCRAPSQDVPRGR